MWAARRLAGPWLSQQAAAFPADLLTLFAIPFLRRLIKAHSKAICLGCYHRSHATAVSNPKGQGNQEKPTPRSSAWKRKTGAARFQGTEQEPVKYTGIYRLKTSRVDLGDALLGRSSGPAAPSLGLAEHSDHSAYPALDRSG